MTQSRSVGDQFDRLDRLDRRYSGSEFSLVAVEAVGARFEVHRVRRHRVQIPMIGSGASLNAAVAGSLVLYRLAGMA